jgi:23S rRNA (uracil1939-C5)-methyltransferase
LVQIETGGGESEVAEIVAATQPQNADIASPPPALECQHFPPCRGCPQIRMPYVEQLAAKRSLLVEALGDLLPAGLVVGDTIPSPRLRGYRNQARLVFRRMSRGGKSRVGLGLYLPGTHRVVHIPHCPIQPGRLNSIAATVLRLAEQMNLSVYDERNGTGALRYLAMRCDRPRKHVLVTLIVGEDTGWPLRQLGEELRREHPEIVGVQLHLNRSRGNVLFAGEDVWSVGAERLEDELGRFRALVSAQSFLQVNHAQAEWIYTRLEERLGEAMLPPADTEEVREVVLDLYSGIGGIALHLARPGRLVVGVEEAAEAVEDARRAAHMNSQSGVRFVVARVEEFLREPALRAQHLGSLPVRAVVLNPPRSGCRAGVMEALSELGPECIAYVSCSPTTLARDLRALGSSYVIEELTGVDMIPLTPHIESLCILRRL